jgi:hypothetical protein
MEKHTFEITETFEVTFPHFRRYAHFCYKVLNETKEISISYYPEAPLQSAEVKYDDICKPNTFRKGSYEITEEEFNETMARALILINNKNQ